MKTKMFLTIGIVSLFVLALAAPASAVLKDSAGKTLAVGSKVTATSGDFISTFTGGITSGCANVTLETEVAENGSQMVLDPTGLSFSQCSLNPGNIPVFIPSAEFEPITLSAGEGSTAFGAIEQVPALAITCGFGGPLALTYATKTNVVVVPGSTIPFTGGSAGCPSSKEMTGEFALTNKLGSVTIE